MKIKLVWKNGTHIIVAYRLFIALIIFSLSRLCLYWFQHDLFPAEYIPSSFTLWRLGLRFDISAVLMLNLPYIFLATLPFPFRNHKYYRNITSFFFYFANFIGILLNIIDSAYFPFNLKRLTWDFTGFLKATNNLGLLIPKLIADFWIYLLVFFVLFLILVLLTTRLRYDRKLFYQSKWNFFGWNLFLMIIWAGIAIVGIRGGLQRRPITLVNAAEMISPELDALILNSPFTIIKTYGKPSLKEVVYYEDEVEANKLFQPVKNYYTPKQATKKLNIVIIIMESFSLEHSALMNPQLYKDSTEGFTPVLDSLMRHGLTFRAYANGKRSIEAIPAICSALPSLMPVEFINSPYVAQPISSLSNSLKPLGYYSIFYHGGLNGTMHFDAYARLAGFDEYKGKNEYQGPEAFDGRWGIFDEPFFQFMANDLSTHPQPFLSVFFSLSSHHPYTVPSKYKNRFKPGKLEIHQSIRYADYALGQFFKTASHQPWFKNTLFIITADHTSEAFSPYYRTLVGQHIIPLIFYLPNDSLRGFSSQIAQQTDIYPSVMDFINAKGSFIAFGRSVFDTTSIPFGISYLNQEYQLIYKNKYLRYFNDKVSGFYDLTQDSLQINNLANQQLPEEEEALRFLKAIIQQYNNRMIHHKLSIDQFDQP